MYFAAANNCNGFIEYCFNKAMLFVALFVFNKDTKLSYNVDRTVN